jgi:hypothetical protein
MLEFVQHADVIATNQDVVMVIACGIVGGVASMLVYGRFSPQGQLKELKLQAADLQQQMSHFDGELAGAMALASQNLKLSFRRLGVAMVPSLWSGLPVLLALLVVREQYVTFFVATAVAALTTKFLFRIA